jgi:hypothetical protein
LDSGFKGQRVDRAADLGPEDRVDSAVLLDSAQPRELRGGHDRAEVVAAAGEIDDLRARAGDGNLDARLQLRGGRHPGVA